MKGVLKMGVNLASPSWWINTFVQTFITIIFIVLIKKIFNKVEVPYVSDMVAEA